MDYYLITAYVTPKDSFGVKPTEINLIIQHDDYEQRKQIFESYLYRKNLRCEFDEHGKLGRFELGMIYGKVNVVYEGGKTIRWQEVEQHNKKLRSKNKKANEAKADKAAIEKACDRE